MENLLFLKQMDYKLFKDVLPAICAVFVKQQAVFKLMVLF